MLKSAIIVGKATFNSVLFKKATNAPTNNTIIIKYGGFFGVAAVFMSKDLTIYFGVLSYFIPVVHFFQLFYTGNPKPLI
ncbi:hypothetical protein D3C80_1274730 [compost metagenome]